MSVPFGSAIGILGGGQLARMMASSAQTLGYEVHVLDPSAECSAAAFVNGVVVAPFDSVEGARALASQVQVVTLDIEKVALPVLAEAGRFAPVHPSAEVLRIVQDRGVQKQWLADHGFAVGPFAVVHDEVEFGAALERLGSRSFIKTCYGGYDGKGQARARTPEERAEARTLVAQGPCTVEAEVDFACELSVLVARSTTGELAVYPPAENHHVQGILRWSVLPARVSSEVRQRAETIARRLAETLDVIGLLTVEFFALPSGEIWVNELAPRPHNSYHATEAACATSQFEQAIRAICGLPLGSTELLRPAALANILGDAWTGGTPAFERALALPGVRLHLYGKKDARPGRKMGHLIAFGSTPDDAITMVQRTFEAFEGER